MRESINKFLSQFDLDVRKSGPDFITQKTADVVLF